MGRISGWTIFTLRGVAVKLHVSLLFLIFYVVLVSMAQFPLVVGLSKLNPDEITGTPFLWALIFSLGLVVSIFLHEFGHVIMAQMRGYKVKGVTLMMLGGISHIEQFTEKPKDEFKIAIIGPLVSLAIAALLFALRAWHLSADIDLFGYWMGQTNLVLGLFNLLPAFPTDGGRVLRSLLVTRQGRLRGTQNAIYFSNFFAILLGLVGILQFNLLMILVAFFIYASAKGEFYVLMGQTVLKGVNIKDLVRNITSISEEATVNDAVTQMVQSRELLLAVHGSTEPIYSLISAKDLRAVPQKLWNSTHLKNLRNEVSNTVKAEDRIEDVLLATLASAEGAVAVVEEGQLIGVIRTSDLNDMIQLRQLTEAQPLAKQKAPMSSSANLAFGKF
jgi:Zn-dependent protease/predicted transcriptional regulator